MSDLFDPHSPQGDDMPDEAVASWLDGQVWAKNTWLEQNGPRSKRPHGEMAIEQKKNDIRMLDEIRRRLKL